CRSKLAGIYRTVWSSHCGWWLIDIRFCDKLDFRQGIRGQDSERSIGTSLLKVGYCFGEVCGILCHKYIVMYLYCCTWVLFGWLIGLPGWSVGVLSDGLYTVLIAMLLTIALSTPVAFFASYGGGYMAPLGFVVFTLVLSQIIAAAGFGEYFPWSVAALYSGVVTEGY